MLPDDVSKGSFINHVAQRGAQKGEIEDQNRNGELILITSLVQYYYNFV